MESSVALNRLRACVSTLLAALLVITLMPCLAWAEDAEGSNNFVSETDAAVTAAKDSEDGPTAITATSAEAAEESVFETVDEAVDPDVLCLDEDLYETEDEGLASAASENEGGAGTSISLLSSVSYRVPVDQNGKLCLTQEFGNNGHKGMDIAPFNAYKSESFNVYASAAGKVVASTYHDSWGNYVKIQHDDGCYTLYAHLSSRSVGSGA